MLAFAYPCAIKPWLSVSLDGMSARWTIRRPRAPVIYQLHEPVHRSMVPFRGSALCAGRLEGLEQTRSVSRHEKVWPGIVFRGIGDTTLSCYLGCLLSEARSPIRNKP